jgi:methylenetetrahydrofolate reductase (NADPH)
MKADSNLEKILEIGEFAVTGELGPPKGNDVEIIKKKAQFLKGNVDAVNITDNQTAVVRMSSIAHPSFFSIWEEPVMQISRDRTGSRYRATFWVQQRSGLRTCSV